MKSCAYVSQITHYHCVAAITKYSLSLINEQCSWDMKLPEPLLVQYIIFKFRETVSLQSMWHLKIMGHWVSVRYHFQIRSAAHSAKYETVTQVYLEMEAVKVRSCTHRSPYRRMNVSTSTSTTPLPLLCDMVTMTENLFHAQKSIFIFSTTLRILKF